MHGVLDTGSDKIGYKVRHHSTAKVPVILAVGKREADEAYGLDQTARQQRISNHLRLTTPFIDSVPSRNRRPKTRPQQGDDYIARLRQPPAPEKSGPRANDGITAMQVRLIGADGEQVGVVSIERAMQAADAVGLDLVEVSPNADPPVCKILDFGKYKYEAQKKANEARKRQKTFDVKEIKMRPNIDTHDYDVKMRSLVNRFIEEGDKVKITIRFRGRELAHPGDRQPLLEKVIGDTDEIAKVEAMAKMEGRQMIMVIAPR